MALLAPSGLALIGLLFHLSLAQLSLYQLHASQAHLSALRAAQLLKQYCSSLRSYVAALLVNVALAMLAPLLFIRYAHMLLVMSLRSLSRAHIRSACSYSALSLRSIAAHIHYVHICSFTIRCAHCSLCAHRSLSLTLILSRCARYSLHICSLRSPYAMLVSRFAMYSAALRIFTTFIFARRFAPIVVSLHSTRLYCYIVPMFANRYRSCSHSMYCLRSARSFAALIRSLPVHSLRSCTYYSLRCARSTLVCYRRCA
jgi:hypothetical protein